jgi:hypothetical protein
MEDRIKSLSQKINDNFSAPIPLGCDSKFVDMHDTNTLEEEFKLGGPCITSFSNVSGNTTIIEEYRKENVTTDFYKVITIFSSTETGDTQIQQTLYYVESSEVEPQEIKSKIVVFKTENDGIVIKEDIQ